MKFIFNRFNKQLEIPALSDAEYHNHLMVEGWTRAETDHLLDLCSRFDLRFPVIHDRWNRQVKLLSKLLNIAKKTEKFLCLTNIALVVRNEYARIVSGRLYSLCYIV